MNDLKEDNQVYVIGNMELEKAIEQFVWDANEIAEEKEEKDLAATEKACLSYANVKDLIDVREKNRDIITLKEDLLAKSKEIESKEEDVKFPVVRISFQVRRSFQWFR